MKKTRLALTTLLVLALAGCATGGRGFKPARLGEVSLGMPKAQVLHLLGKPVRAATYSTADLATGTSRRKEALRYVEIVRGANQTNFFVVVFCDGALVDYGPEVGRLAAELEGVFSEYPKESEPAPAAGNR
jgi:hypothetical protein